MSRNWIKKNCGCCWYITFYTHKNSLIASRVYFCSSPSWFPFVCLFWSTYEREKWKIVRFWHFLTIFGAKNYNWNSFFKHSKFEFLCQTTKFHILSFFEKFELSGIFGIFWKKILRIFLKFILKFPSPSSSLKDIQYLAFFWNSGIFGIFWKKNWGNFLKIKIWIFVSNHKVPFP